MALPPRSHPLVRSRRVDQLNSLLDGAWRKGFSPRPTLDPEQLWAKALQDDPAIGETGIRPPEDVADFRLRLNELSRSLEAEADLNPLGQTFAHGQLVRVIRQRLQLGALWQDRPQIAETNMAPPIIVVGQMRSGTTRIHRLLAADPEHVATRFCDSWHPVPRMPDTRPAWSALSLSFARTLDPWLDSIHPFGVTRADEELGWLASALDHCAYEAQWRIPAFTAFSEERDPAPVYREFARILRTDAEWRHNARRPRILKVPQFAEDLPALLEQFPDARVVRTRRDEEALIRSASSLVANQMTIQSDNVDIAWIERECRRKIALRRARMDHALQSYTGPLAEVDFTALDDDWQDTIKQVYRQLGITLSAGALAAMGAEQARNSRGPHQRHGEDYRSFEDASA